MFDKVVCERGCVKDGVWQSGVSKMLWEPAQNCEVLTSKHSLATEPRGSERSLTYIQQTKLNINTKIYIYIYILKTQTTKTKPNQLMIWIGNCTALQKCQDREPSRKLMALLFFTARWSMDRFSMESILNLVDGSLFTHPRLANQIWLRMKRIGPPLGVELKSHEWRNWWNMKQRWEITLIDKASNSPKQQNEKSK